MSNDKEEKPPGSSPVSIDIGNSLTNLFPNDAEQNSDEENGSNKWYQRGSLSLAICSLIFGSLCCAVPALVFALLPRCNKKLQTTPKQSRISYKISITLAILALLAGAAGVLYLLKTADINNTPGAMLPASVSLEQQLALSDGVKCFVNENDGSVFCL